MALKKACLPSLVSVMILAASLPVTARTSQRTTNADQPRPQLTQEQRQAHREYREEQIQARLNFDAKQLNITKNQQAAWNNYGNALKHMMRSDVTPPPANADAATMAKFRADRAAEHAKTLAQLSDATTKLQTVLTAEQRAEFTRMYQGPAHHDGPGFGPRHARYHQPGDHHRGGGYGYRCPGF